MRPATEQMVKMLFALGHKNGNVEAVKDAVHNIKAKHGDVIPFDWVKKQLDRLTDDGARETQTAVQEGAAKEPDGSEGYNDDEDDDSEIPF